MVRAAVVDDNHLFLDRIGELLDRKGWEVLSCLRSEDVVSLVEKEQPDLILLNLGLETGLGGRSLLDYFRADQATRCIPLIIYSGLRDPAGPADDPGPAGPPTPPSSDHLLQGLAGMLEAGLGTRQTAPPTLPPSLSIQLLGSFRVCAGTIPVEDSHWGLRKARTMVKLLALTPQHRLHREEIMELLWPNTSVGSSVKNFHTALHVARHALEPALPARSPSSYLRLQGDFLSLDRTGDGIDVDVFQRAAQTAQHSRDPSAYEAALHLYRGELLPEDRNEEWSIGYRAALAATRTELLVQLAALRVQQGEAALAIAALQQVVEANPSHEEAQAELMRLLVGVGHRTQALHHYQQLCTALRVELDVEPGPDTRALLEQIQTGQCRVSQ